MPTTTRRSLVQDVLRTLGDLRVLTATRDGSDVTFYDDANLAGEPGAYTGREVLFVSGTADNIGKLRYVTGSADRGIGFGVSLPAATATGDEAWVVNTRGVGYRFQDVYDAINQAIRAIRDRSPVPATTDSVTYGEGDAIVVPPEFVRVENVQWQDEYDTDLWRPVVKTKRPNGTGWWLDRASRSVFIGGSPAESMDGRTVRIWGLAEPAELYDDDDTTGIHADWLTKQAAATIARARFMRAPTPETERTYFSIMQEAGVLRPFTVTRRSALGEDL
jgi:hypothetical protein